jgi:hypothetical protein
MEQQREPNEPEKAMAEQQLNGPRVRTGGLRI